MRQYLIPVVLISSLVDFLLLIGAGQFAGRRLNLRRVLMASVVGGIYRGVCILSSMAILNMILIRILCAVVMSIIAYGMQVRSLRPGALFVILEMALGGILSGTGEGKLLPVLLGSGVLWCLCFVSNLEPTMDTVSAELTHRGKTYHISALIDSGNLLQDPVTGERVIVVSSQVGSQLAGLTESQLADPVHTILTNPHLGMRLIPYRSIGMENGLLLTMRIDEVKLAGRKAGNLIAFAPCGLGSNQRYQALVGGCI